MMEEILKYLPVIIPLFVIQAGLMVASLIHIFKYNKYKMGNRPLWIIICVLVSILGPVLYFIIGRGEE